MRLRLLTLFLLTCCFTVLLEALGFAACANVVGTWSGTINGVTCDTSIDQCSFLPARSFAINITKQKGCFFHGRTDKSELLQGMITGDDVRLTSANPHQTFLFDGLLAGYNSTTGKYTQLIMTGTNFPAPGAETISTDADSFKGTLIRSQ